MNMNRGDFPRPRKMVNYSHMLVAALALTSFILLVKYRNLTGQMSEENVIHIMSQKALQSDLETEMNQKKKSEQKRSELDKALQETSNQLQSSKAELSNTAKALQLSYQQIETLKQENISKSEEINRMREGNDELQQQIRSLQDSLAGAEDTIAKTKALADDNANTLKGFQEKYELLLNHNQRMGIKLAETVQTHKGEIENLNNQLKAALEDANLAKAKVTELENLKPQSPGDRTRSVKEGDQGNTTNLDKQPDAAAKNEEKPQGQENNKLQETTGVVNAKQSTSNAISIDNTNTANAAPSKSANDNGELKNISEELKHYDMLEDDVKEQIKKERQATDNSLVTDQELEEEEEEEELVDQEQVLKSPKEQGNEKNAGEEAEAKAGEETGATAGEEAGATAGEEQNADGNQEVREAEENKEEVDEEENEEEEGGDVATADEDSAMDEKRLKVSKNQSGSFDISPSEMSYSTEANAKA